MKFAHKLTLALLVVLAVVLSLCNTVLIGQQFRQELHTAQETLSADWQRESRAMQRTLVTPGSGSLAARVGSYLQAITEQNSLAYAAYSVDGTSLYYALPTAVSLSEVEALLAQDGEPRMVLANNHTLLCAGTVVLPERCITLVIAQDAAPVWQARQARTRNALIVELLAMVLAGGLVLLLCRRMTRPLEQLEQAVLPQHDALVFPEQRHRLLLKDPAHRVVDIVKMVVKMLARHAAAPHDLRHGDPVQGFLGHQLLEYSADLPLGRIAGLVCPFFHIDLHGPADSSPLQSSITHFPEECIYAEWGQVSDF